MQGYSAMSDFELREMLRSLEDSKRGLQAPDLLEADLRIHQVELEAQNRELRTAMAKLEASRQAYVDLFDFAPVALITLDRAGIIHELNLRALRLSGRVRSKVERMPSCAS
jgi:PAS domain-containing protein